MSREQINFLIHPNIDMLYKLINFLHMLKVANVHWKQVMTIGMALYIRIIQDKRISCKSLEGIGSSCELTISGHSHSQTFFKTTILTSISV